MGCKPLRKGLTLGGSGFVLYLWDTFLRNVPPFLPDPAEEESKTGSGLLFEQEVAC
jgi:hypothetical protein